MRSPNPAAIAIYDLDRTITRAPTFTPFLLFAAAQRAPWRLLALPAWIAALIGYKLKFYGRDPMKAFGVRLFIGRWLSEQDADALAARFIARLETRRRFLPGALATIAADRARGAKLIVVTAAPQFYADAIARHLGFDDCLSTCHRRGADGSHSCHLAARNNYGPEKMARLRGWLAGQGLERADCHIVAYSDHRSDAPMLDWADEGVFVGKAPAGSGWRSVNWN